jgi:hypothetical protein
MRLYRTTALAFAIAFAAVGAVFLLAPHAVSTLFDWLGQLAGARGMPPGDLASGLFRALAVAYMYVVTSLAWMMYRRPTETIWPALLAHAKLASAAVSFLLLVLHGYFLAYLANGVVDGAIGAAVLLLRRSAASGRGNSPVGEAR